MSNSPDQIATIVANGQTYAYWTSVEIERSVGDGISHMTFTSAEISQNSESWANLKLGLWTKCQGYLGGQLAISGQIESRQVYYNKDTHSVQLVIMSFAQELTSSTVKASPGQYSNTKFADIAKKDR